jgi:hypothetical protein
MNRYYAPVLSRTGNPVYADACAFRLRLSRAEGYTTILL